jgi:hypothetical protein
LFTREERRDYLNRQLSLSQRHYLLSPLIPLRALLLRLFLTLIFRVVYLPDNSTSGTSSPKLPGRGPGTWGRSFISRNPRSQAYPGQALSQVLDQGRQADHQEQAMAYYANSSPPPPSITSGFTGAPSSYGSASSQDTQTWRSSLYGKHRCA